MSRIPSRDTRDLYRWARSLDHFRHLTALVFVPLLVGGFTAISNAVDSLSFLLFPPLAAATYGLFAHPEAPSSSPRDVIGGFTVGALSGWAALVVVGPFVAPPSGPFDVNAGAVVVTLVLTGTFMRLFDIETAPAFAVGLLVLFVDVPPGTYVLNVIAGSTLVAGAFVVWDREVYDRRIEHLYAVTDSGSNVLVAMRGDDTADAAFFGARIAAEHETSKVVLLGLIADDTSTDDGESADLGSDTAAASLDRTASHIREEIGVPCEVIVARDRARNPATATLRTAREVDCDLVVTPYEEEEDTLSTFIRRLFRGDVNVIAARLSGDRDRWDRVLVTVRRAGDIAHTMVDFARRLAGESARISICTCIADESERRPAETMCANIAEAFDGPFETRVSNESVDAFIAGNAPRYDLAFISAGMDRSRASRAVSPSTFERIRRVDCDLAIVHRA